MTRLQLIVLSPFDVRLLSNLPELELALCAVRECQVGVCEGYRLNYPGSAVLRKVDQPHVPLRVTVACIGFVYALFVGAEEPVVGHIHNQVLVGGGLHKPPYNYARAVQAKPSLFR